MSSGINYYGFPVSLVRKKKKKKRKAKRSAIEWLNLRKRWALHRGTNKEIAWRSLVSNHKRKLRNLLQ